LRACEIAGVKPEFTKLNGHDVRAFVVSANLARRNLSMGQQAMALAMIYPEGKRGVKTLDISRSEQTLLYQARKILRHSVELAQDVLHRGTHFDVALRAVRGRRRCGRAISWGSGMNLICDEPVKQRCHQCNEWYDREVAFRQNPKPGSEGYIYPACRLCEQTASDQKKRMDRWLIKARDTTVRHAKRYGLSLEQMSVRFVWEAISGGVHERDRSAMAETGRKPRRALSRCRRVLREATRPRASRHRGPAGNGSKIGGVELAGSKIGGSELVLGYDLSRQHRSTTARLPFVL
jgi:hypothetical protein